MKGGLSRQVLALAIHSLGTRHRAWAQAMRAEFEVAHDDGHGLRFACGCLIGAWRMLPHHGEGRFMLASYALSLGLLLPMGAVVAIAALAGFPYVDASEGARGFLMGRGAFISLLNPGTQCVAPLLTVLMLVLAACHGPVAWWVLDRDWRRVGIATRFGAAVMATVVIVLACAAVGLGSLVQPCAVLGLECTALSALAAWHAQGFGDETT